MSSLEFVGAVQLALSGQQRVQVFVEIFQIAGVYRLAAQWTLILSLDPVFNTSSVEVVLNVTRKRGHLILFCKLLQTDRALLLAGK